MKFKTTINCSSCIRAVTPSLNAVDGIDKWEVDTENPDKILTVSGSATTEQIVRAVKKAGFEIEPLAN